MKNKGFTLVEILATITILAILMIAAIPSMNNLIKKSKEEHDENIINTVIMATKSYVQDNKKDAPKYIGAKSYISLKDLKDKNYLKEDIYDSAKNTCMKYSYVTVFKKDTKDYVYSAHLDCAGRTLESKETTKPSVNIYLRDKNGKEYKSNNASHEMSITKVRVTMFGGENNSDTCNSDLQDGPALVGYSIFIYKYTNIKKNEYVEIYNSGSLRANGKKCLTVEIDLSKYIDITQENKLKIVARANNEFGNESIESFDAKFDDTEKPICKAVYNEAKEGEWSKAHERTVIVKCDDNGGSGCKQDVYVKTFDKEMAKGKITIKDNKGNKRDCDVNVNLDWTKPTVNIKAYKLKANGKNGKEVADKTVNDADSPYALKNYEDGYGSDSWLNKANYPYGIHYNVKIDDAYTLKEGKWKLNAKNLTENSNNKNNITELFTNEFTKKNENVNFDIVDEGYRYGEFTVSDKAGNTTKIEITALIDRTAPSIPTVSMYEKNSNTKLNNDSNLSRLSEYSDNTWINKWVFTKASGSTDVISGFDYYEHTVTGAATNVANEKGSYKNVHKEGISYISYKAVDKAGNSSNLVTKTIKLDRTKPKCTTSKTAEGENGVTVSIDCQKNDKLSDINCPTTEVGLKSNKEFEFQDEAGNSGKCSVSISSKTQYLLKSCTGHSACQKTDECLSYGDYYGICECYYDNNGVRQKERKACVGSIGNTCTKICQYYYGGKYYSGVIVSPKEFVGKGRDACIRNCETYKYVASESCPCLNWSPDGYWSDSVCSANSSTTCNNTGFTRLYYY